MSLKNRIKKLESDLNPEKDRVPVFKVTRLEPGQWKIRKAIHEAKRVLGLLSPSEIRRKAFIGIEKHQGLYSNLDEAEAKSILQQHGEVVA